MSTLNTHFHPCPPSLLMEPVVTFAVSMLDFFLAFACLSYPKVNWKASLPV